MKDIFNELIQCPESDDGVHCEPCHFCGDDTVDPDSCEHCDKEDCKKKCNT